MEQGIPTDPISGILTRRSMQSRRSIDPTRMSTDSLGYRYGGDTEGLMRHSEAENGDFGLHDLARDSDGEPTRVNGRKSRERISMERPSKGFDR